MKWACYLIAGGILLAPASDRAAETAQVRVDCLSPRFERSEDQSGSFALDLTTLSSGVNGELAFGDFFNVGYSHSTYVILTDTLFGDQYEGAMALGVPVDDANGDSYPDFFEVSQAVNATTNGLYNISGLGSGTVYASWGRNAGSYLCTCVLTLHGK